MKPKSKLQAHIFNLSKQLPPLTEKQRRYAEEHAFPLMGYRNRSKGLCTHCGEPLTFPKDKHVATIRCPHCGRKLEVEDGKKRSYVFNSYFTIVTTVKGFQVCRHFFCRKHIRRWRSPEYEFEEAVQNWIDSSGKEIVIARSTIAFTGYMDYWNFNTELSIKYKRCLYTYAGTRYDIQDTTVYPHIGLLKEVRRNGLTSLKEYEAIAPNLLLSAVLSDLETENLIKHGQKALLHHKFKTSWDGVQQLKHPESVRIACRHKYIVPDASLWMDYLSLLEHFELDTHNPHYVCPANLNEAHDRLMERKRREDVRLGMKERMKEARKWEKKYHRAKAPFFGIVFGNENIVISVIQSVADMAEEGISMHHCVFDMGYYRKKHSLILTARTKDGKRLETIEVNLKTFQIVQSRGVCNQNTEYHDEIIKLVEDNMDLIRKAA